MKETFLTVLQASQLIALGPSLFVVVFLLLTSKKRLNVTVPVFYFIAVSCSFMVPLVSLFIHPYTSSFIYVKAALLFLQSLSPAFCFLLVIQFIQRRVPPALFWLILALPVLGGSSFIYGNVMLDEVCIFGNNCFETDKLMSLYNLFGSMLMFLLLIVYYERHHPQFETKDAAGYHTYCFIMALVVLSVIEVAIDLAYISDNLREYDAQMLGTMLRIGFVYLVLTSVFKIFDSRVEIDVEKIPTFVALAPHTDGLTEKDTPLIAQILTAMQEKKYYREMGCTREEMAEKIGIHEVTLSRVINQHFHKNFNEFINTFRVLEAKDRLLQDATPITVIAFEVGFNSIASFNRAFKEMVGCSPRDFRHAHHKPA